MHTMQCFAAAAVFSAALAAAPAPDVWPAANGSMEIAVDKATGCVVKLRDKTSGEDYVTSPCAAPLPIPMATRVSTS